MIRIPRRPLLGVLKHMGFATEVDLRFAMRKLTAPPFKGIRGYLTRCVYMLNDEAFPTNVRLFKPTPMQLAMGVVFIYCKEKFRGKAN